MNGTGPRMADIGDLEETIKVLPEPLPDDVPLPEPVEDDPEPVEVETGPVLVPA